MRDSFVHKILRFSLSLISTFVTVSKIALALFYFSVSKWRIFLFTVHTWKSPANILKHRIYGCYVTPFIADAADVEARELWVTCVFKCHRIFEVNLFSVAAWRDQWIENKMQKFYAVFFLNFYIFYIFIPDVTLVIFAKFQLKKNHVTRRDFNSTGIEVISFLLRSRAVGFKGQRYGVNKSVSRSKNMVSPMPDILHERPFLSFVGIW